MLFLIGHRGVGKTSLIKNIPGGLDLDAEISKDFEIESFFENDKESDFRDLEHTKLKELVKDSNVKAVALGAGFLLESFDFPEDSKIIWIQRRSDLKGRVFLDRPRLNTQLSALDEYKERFEARQLIYNKHADFKLEVEEGDSKSVVPILNSLVMVGKLGSDKAYYTLKSSKELVFFKGKIELRTDLLTEAEILEILKRKTEYKFLVALRTKASAPFVEEIKSTEGVFIDLPFENWPVYERDFLNTENVFLSSHDLLTADQIASVLKTGLHLKWAPLVKTVFELKNLYNLVKSLDVSFLPRDETGGRFNWMRQSLLSKNKINFYRTGLSDYLDQPRLVDLGKSFGAALNGAVLGGDVSLSHSPSFHSSFFHDEFKASYASISLNEDEFSKENLLFFKSLGFSFFSITAPFKKELKNFGSGQVANTMFIGPKDVFHTTDTDKFSIESLASSLRLDSKILIWGAGDMGQALFKCLGPDHAKLVSVRNYKGEPLGNFNTLIWCAGEEALKLPNFTQKPKVIFDLEYKESSRAREVALEKGSQYISGKSFFETQAVAQQEFWKKKHKESV